jgi:hypothetical protein
MSAVAERATSCNRSGVGRPGALFHAVVIMGCGLACGRDKQAPSTPPSNIAAPIEPPKPRDAPADAGIDAPACPPGSELPYPPCYHIR